MYAEGPAAALWLDGRRRPLAPTLDDALQGAEALLSGTGWQSSLEHSARHAATQSGIMSFAALDHWVNFTERFVRSGRCILPDAFLVADKEAEEIAFRTFPGIAVHRLPNLYLAQQVLAIEALGKAAKNDTVLAIMEPARDSWGKDVPGEFQALDYLLARWSDAGFGPAATLVIRPHPSEPIGKYDAWVAGCSRIEAGVSGNRSLAQDIALASTVVGLNSYALTIALAAGRNVWSMLPPWAPDCALPHAEIRHLRSLPKILS